MTPLFQPEELSAWVGRPWENGRPAEVRGVGHDTRTLRPGMLYVALRGERFDGHDFLDEAFARGASAALVAEECRVRGGPLLRVPDTLAGLHALARGYRRTWTAHVVGVTGSAGKTTVKELCAAVLSRRGETHATAGNFNNHIGLPLTMLAMPRAARFGVFEIGMNRPGEIAELAALLQPHTGIVTAVGAAHREAFGSVEEIAREKAALLEALPPDGLVLLPADDEWYDLLRNAAGNRRLVSVSLEGKAADYRADIVDERTFELDGVRYRAPAPGAHMLRNTLLAVALGREYGLPPAEIAAALQAVELPPMRWQQIELHGVTFINDAYNANPLSMRAALRAFLDAPARGNGRRWVVLGGMRELGAAEEEEHRALGRFLRERNPDGVLLVGPAARAVRPADENHWLLARDTREAARLLRERLRPGDRVLLKASRGERLERILENLKEA